ncbi:MAG TPA: hydroxymethylbilane synthase [Candidatus Acidoferrum sp.]|nr:hydroxymethylbilane synthase [Candidatus Acidoferrum sp.]
MKPVRIGSRGSMLAVWQAEHIAEQLGSLGIPSDIIYIKTSGDRFQQAGVNQIGVKGVFIKEIEDALLENRVDIAVHSMKDVPTEIPIGLAIAAICKREDPRDCLISPSGETFAKLPPGARVGTGSLRRQAQLRHARPDLTFMDLRGNVDTRLGKLDRGDFETIVLAKAGLDRLNLSGRITEVISDEICLPAVGQGAIGIEVRADDSDVLDAAHKLNDVATNEAVTAERVLLRELEGGCQVPLGAWARRESSGLTMDACVVSPDGGEYIRKRGVGESAGGEQLGLKLAQELMAAGAGRILKLVGRNVAGHTGN